MQSNVARLIFTDEQFNVAIGGHVTGGDHREFVMASGEMSGAQFLEFNRHWIGALLPYLIDGGIVGTFIDWRGLPIVHTAATGLGLSPVNLIVWSRPMPAWAVSIDPNTSCCKFPANREIYREFYENRVVWRKIARKNAAKSVSCWTIPYKMKQGINSRRTGNLSSRAGNLQRLAGNCPPCAEDVEHQQGRMLGVVGPRDRPLWCDERQSEQPGAVIGSC
jgi:hypothetical protein